MNNYMEKAVHDWSEDSVRLIITPSVTAKSTYFYVQEIGYFKTHCKYYTERANLSSYLIVYTISGKGLLKYKDKTYSIIPGQVFFIDCMEYQYYYTEADDQWEFLWVHFNGGTTHGYYEQFIKNGSQVVSLSPSTQIPTLIRELISMHQQKDIRTEPLSSKLLVDLLTELLLSVTVPDSDGSFLPDYIKAVIKDMEKRFSEKLTLDELARKHAVSKFHLAREFKKYTGLSPNEYLINARITYAKELLKYSTIPVAEIALRAGIDNVSHFINLFKEREEKTPLAFRKEWQHQRQ